MLPTNVVIVIAVALTSIILYILDRRNKGEPVEGGALAKIGSFAGIVTGGVVFALQADGVAQAVESVSEVAQDMFVGQPAF